MKAQIKPATYDRAMRLRYKRNRHHALQAIVTVIAIITVIQVIAYIQSQRAVNEQTRATNQQLINEYGGN